MRARESPVLTVSHRHTARLHHELPKMPGATLLSLPVSLWLRENGGGGPGGSADSGAV